jgi:DNA repair photolyase
MAQRWAPGVQGAVERVSLPKYTTLCHRIPNFIEKAAQAGVRRVFIGLENINPDNLIAGKKRQNKITEYREAAELASARCDHLCRLSKGAGDSQASSHRARPVDLHRSRDRPAPRR